MYSYVVRLDGDEFSIKSNEKIYAYDCIALEDETFFVYDREGNKLFVMPMVNIIEVYE